MFLRKLNLKQIKELFIFAVKQPLFIIPTIKASVLCLKICDKEFGATHHKSNKANAFRHALWNILLIKKCSKNTQNNLKAISWARTITTWHETFSVNKVLERKMDLHNNEIGRWMYFKVKNLSEEVMITILLKKTAEAIKMKEPFQEEFYREALVFISE